MAGLPNAFAARVAAEADAIAQVPDAHQFLHRATRGGDAGGQRIGRVERNDRHIDAVGFERLAQARREGEPLQLAQVGSFFDHAVADHAGNPGAHRIHRRALPHLGDQFADRGDHFIRVQRFQIDAVRVAELRVGAHGAQAG